MIDVSEIEDNTKKREIGNFLIGYLQKIFLKERYISNEELHRDIDNFLNSDYFEYVIEGFERDHGINIRNLMQAKRFKICDNCGHVFVAVDRGNREKFCNRDIYRRFSNDGKEMNKRKLTSCKMDFERKRSAKNRKK